MPRKPASPGTVEQVLALYAQGKQQGEIATAVGISRGGVWHILSRAGVPRNRLRRVTAEQLQRATEAYQSGATLEASAAAGGCSVFTVWTHLKKLGLLREKEVDEGAILEKARSGLTPFEIAHGLGLNLADVLAVLRSVGYCTADTA